MSVARRVWSWLLLLGGLLLLISGSREFLSSYLSQEEISGEWREEVRQQLGQEKLPSLRQFQQGDFIARLSIPRLESDFFVVEGAGKKELRRGPGHLEGTALPGEPDNTIIAGHRDTHFRALKDIRPGDDIVIAYDGEELNYRVTNTKIVNKTNKQVLRPSRRAKLTLITCYPFYYVGPAPKRFIVEADLTHRVALETGRRTADSTGM
jgi:sortase A